MEPFKVHVLGCGSAKPTTRHYASSQVVEVRGRVFMVDCGEGTQIQLRHTKVRFTRLKAVFISHLHGDHCFGLIGLICSFALSGRKVPLHIYAPVALKRLLEDMLAMFAANLEFEVVFHPVDTTVAQVIYEDSAVTVSTLPLQHRIPCCGYLFREKEPQLNIIKSAIAEYKLSLEEIASLKRGEDVLRDGTLLPFKELTYKPFEPRSFAYCSDTGPFPKLKEWIRGTDLIYHEATYASDLKALSKTTAHSTSEDAAKVALEAGAKTLVVGHFSSRYRSLDLLLDEARKIFPETYLAQEGMKFEVPLQENPIKNQQ